MNELVRNEDGTFKKGATGNAAGRPAIGKHERELMAKCRQMVPKIFDILEEILDVGVNRDRLLAIKLLLEYGFGKPKQILEIENKTEGKELKDITSVQLVAQLNEILQLEAIPKDSAIVEAVANVADVAVAEEEKVKKSKPKKEEK